LAPIGAGSRLNFSELSLFPALTTTLQVLRAFLTEPCKIFEHAQVGRGRR